MTTYRLEMDEQGDVVHAIPGDIGTLDGALVFQIADGYHVSETEMQRAKAQLQEAFPDRRVLILSAGIRFVRFVSVEDTP